MMTNGTQVDRWRGEFGNAYIDRNPADPGSLRARTAMWAQILQPLAGSPPRSILEVGANIGGNLRALTSLTAAELYAVEPNVKARQVLVGEAVLPESRVLDGTASRIDLQDSAVDLVFTCGVLIHVDPADLPDACREIFRVSRRYVACIEYFSENPSTMRYRDHDDMLFLRDFGAFWLDGFPELRLVAHGFVWKRVTGFDNMVWQVFEKRGD